MDSFIKENSVRCFWPGLSIPLGKKGDFLEKYFKVKYNITIEHLEQAKTLPGNGPKGGVIVQIFNVEKESIEKLEEIKSKEGILYDEEIVRNNEQHIYNERIYLKYLKNTENKLIQLGEVSKENIYQSSE